ncbi:MAG TPA: HAD family hydrolase [Verrucomicrobiae bacterium]|nr:HAD family hydrolase [Verrucomicrobiae bacterium]
MSDMNVIFWDVYGTLIAAERGDLDSLIRREAELRTSFERTVKNFGLSISPARLHDLFLRSIEAEREARRAEGIMHPEVRVDEIWFKMLEKLQPDASLTVNFAREVALFFERQANPKQWQPRAYEVLTTLQNRRFRQGILSNAQFYTPIELSALLRHESAGAICTYESVFDPRLVFFSFEMGVAKPDPAAFRPAVEALTRENLVPDSCVFIGDSLVNDIAPAEHLGFRTVLYAPVRATESPVKPDLVIHNLSQLLEWL